VRAHGQVGDIPAAGAADHVCWVYEDDEEFDRAVLEFVAGGLERGERVFCVGDRVVESLHVTLGDLDDLVARGALETLPLADAYDSTGTFVPEDQLAFYDTATRRARDDGFAGLRVVAEISALAADPEVRPELVRWEHLADDFAASGSGFSALCAYRGDLDREALTDVATVHPLVHAPEGLPTFRVFVDDEAIVLAGCIDTFAADRLAGVLATSPVGSPAVLDLGPVEFLDVAACRALALWARDLSERAVPLEVRGSSSLVRRMWQLLALDVITTVTFTGENA
jgi:MEDS: MEthanogen/methylotroph, DcmR Sensory domain/STAS domain